jgi:outer membrane usher protein
MSKKPCARTDELRAENRLTAYFLPFFSLAIILISIIYSSVSLAQQTAPAEQIIVGVNLNAENKGDVIVYLTPDKDFFIGIDELKEIGFAEPKGTRSIIEQKPYISLRSMRGVTYDFDENKLSLNIVASPELLATKVFDFQPKRAPRVYYPSDNSFFLNYGASYASELYRSENRSFNLTNELGMRLNNILFLTETTYTQTSADSNFVRLQSSAIYDFRQDMRRLVAGDYFASSGNLGASVNMGGLSYSKLYSIDPYFIKQPLFNFAGQTRLPSEADIYVDGVLIRREKLSPGSFELQNIQAYGGYRNVNVVLRDAFGREQLIQNPFFSMTSCYSRAFMNTAIISVFCATIMGSKAMITTNRPLLFFTGMDFQTN